MKAAPRALKALIFITILGLYLESCATVPSKYKAYRCDPWEGEQSIRLPGWDNAWHTTMNCSVANPTEVSIAMKVFYLQWIEAFGDPERIVKENLHRLLIVWGNELKEVNGYSIDGTYRTHLKAQGLAHTKGLVWVMKDSSTKICDSSLVHELVHVSIWVLKETDGDPDHLGKKYDGWTVDHSALIQNVNNELCLLGI